MGLIERLSQNVELAIAGLVGAVIAMRLDKQLSTWQGKAFFVFSGVMCAYYTTPLAISKWDISPELSGGVGFLLGAFGSSLLATGLSTIKSVDFVALLKSKFGGPEK